VFAHFGCLEITIIVVTSSCISMYTLLTASAGSLVWGGFGRPAFIDKQWVRVLGEICALSQLFLDVARGLSSNIIKEVNE
jgi:hypothetical protein